MPAPLRPSPRTRAATRRAPSSCGTRAGTSTRVAEDGGLGAYMRIGLLPEPRRRLVHGVRVRALAGRRWRSWTSRRRCRRGRICAPSTDGARGRARCEAPLERFRCTLEGTGESHDDQSAPLRGERGRAGAGRARPHLGDRRRAVRLPVATRYEIPCLVEGTVRVGDEELALRGPRPARPLVGRARLVVDGLDVERGAPGRRRARARGRDPAARRPGLRRRLRAAPRAVRSSELESVEATEEVGAERPRRAPRASPWSRPDSSSTSSRSRSGRCA